MRIFMWLGTFIASNAFAVTGMTRVGGECFNVDKPTFKTHFELDARNDTENEDNVLAHTDQGSLRIKVELWAKPANDEYSSSINFRLDLNALKETVGTDSDRSIAQVFKPIDHRHFTLTKGEAEAGKRWQANWSMNY